MGITRDIRDELRAYFRMRGVAEAFWLETICGKGESMSFSLEPGQDEDYIAVLFRTAGGNSPILTISVEDAREIVDVLEAFIHVAEAGAPTDPRSRT